MDPRWYAVRRMATGLRKIAETIDFGTPPLDDFDREIRQARWLLDQIEQATSEIRKEDRANNIRLIFGNTGKILE